MRSNYASYVFIFQCQGLENELSENVQLLSSCKSHAAGLDAEHSELSTTAKSLRKTIKEKDLKMSNLEEKNANLIEEHETETENLQHQLNMLHTKVREKEVRVFLQLLMCGRTCMSVYV